MPIYEIAGKKVNAQNPLSEEEIDEIYSSITKPQQPKEEPGRFGAAFSRSLHSAKEAVQGVGLGITSAIDTPEHTQDWMNQSRALQNEEVAGPKSMSFEDLQNIYKDKGILSGIAETPGFAAEKFAESSAESLAPFVVGGIAGAFTGGVGAPIVAGITTSIIQQFGHDMARQAQEKIQAGELNPSDAIAAAIPQGVLDYASDRFTFGMKMMPGAKNAIKQAAKEEIEKSIWSRIGGGMVKGAITEPPTEVAQQYLERSQAGLPTDNEEAYREYKEAGGSALAAGALGGGAFGAIERSNQPTQAPPISEPQTTTEELPAEEAVNVDTTRPTSLNEVVAPETESNLIKQKINGEEETIDRNQRIYDKDGNITPIRTHLISPTILQNEIFNTLKSLDENDKHDNYTDKVLLDIIDDIRQVKEEAEDFKNYVNIYKKFIKIKSVRELNKSLLVFDAFFLRLTTSTKPVAADSLNPPPFNIKSSTVIFVSASNTTDIVTCER
jgi:hypothetical protein